MKQGFLPGPSPRILMRPDTCKAVRRRPPALYLPDMPLLHLEVFVHMTERPGSAGEPTASTHRLDALPSR